MFTKITIFVIVFICLGFNWNEQSAWQKHGFDKVEISKIYDNHEASKNFHLVFIIRNDSKFKQDYIVQKIDEIKNIYQQCDIAFNEITLIKLTDKILNEPLVRYTESPKSLESLRKRIPIQKDVILFNLISGFSDSEKTSGFSFAKWKNSEDHVPSLFNTIWITDYILSPEYQAKNNNQYDIFSHELIHVLTRMGSHISPKYESLRSIARARTNKILAKTCELID